MGKVAFVTGSTGFLGLHIIEQLVNDGWEVLALRRSTSRTTDLSRFPVTQVEGDVTDLNSLRKVIPEKVDALFHTAADTSMWALNNARQRQINVGGAQNIVKVALEKQVGRLVHTSSIGAFGKQSDIVLTESTPSNSMRSGINYYETKYLAEQVVLEGIREGLDAVMLNPAQIVGAFDYNHTPTMFKALKEGYMKGVPPGNTVCGHVRDYAKAHVVAFEKGRCGENYLLGGKKASFKEVFDVIGQILQVKTPTTPLPSWLLQGTAFVMEKISYLTKKEPVLTPEKVALLNVNFDIDSSKAETELGFSTCSLLEMYTDAYEWMRENKLI